MARLISAEEVLSALIDTLVNPSLAKIPPFGGVKAAEPNISSQMEAVAWLYNRYLGKELPHLKALDWENICNISCRKETRLSKFMGPAFSIAQGLSLTEQKIKSACEVVESLRSLGNIKGTRTITKVCVCLLNYRQDKCVLVLGAATVGVWSFIEKRRRLECIKETSGAVFLSDEELAFQAVEEHTGIKPDFLQLKCSFLINDDLSGSGGSTKFYIMSCSGTFDLSCVIKVERIAWVSIDNVLPKAHEPLIDALDQIVRSSPAVYYFHLRPFCWSLENWLTKNQKVEDVRNFKHPIEANLECQAEKSVSKFGSLQMELDNEESILLKLNTEMSDVSTHIDVPTNWRPQVLTELKVNTDFLISSIEETRAAHSGFVQKLEEEKQQLIDLSLNTVAMEGQLSIDSPQSSTLLRNIPEPLLRNGRCINDVANDAGKHCEDKLRQMHQAVDEVALSLNMSTPNDRPHATRTKKREEEHILDKAAALLSLKTAYRNVKKRRKTLSKELSNHTQQMDKLYKKIAECDTLLATLIGGGKGAQQLAVELCKKDPEKQISSDVSIDHSHAAAKANRLQADRPATINKNKAFYMLKSSMQELNEVCTKNSWPMPSYGVFMHKNIQGENVFSGKVRIRNNIFELSESGEASPSSKSAKLSAAAYMLSSLHRLKACSGTM